MTTVLHLLFLTWDLCKMVVSYLVKAGMFTQIVSPRMHGFFMLDLFLQDHSSIRFHVEYVLPRVLNQPTSFQKQKWKANRKI
jgi:hypothetical protein